MQTIYRQKAIVEFFVKIYARILIVIRAKFDVNVKKVTKYSRQEKRHKSINQLIAVPRSVQDKALLNSTIL